MGHEGRGGRIADDFPAIAARLREPGGRSGQVATRAGCRMCDGRGWLWSATIHDRRGCPRCGLSQHHPKPPPPR